MKESGLLVVGLAACLNIGCTAAVGGSSDLQQVGEAHAASLSQSLERQSSTAASYTWPVPDGWFVEKYALPPPWYPELAFTGSEELRFPPGFLTPASGEYWSYDFLQWIESGPAITESVLEHDMTIYYKGLLDCGGAVQCDPNRFAARFERLARTPLLTVFAGSVDSYDYAGVPITLDMVISSVVCPRSKHRALLVTASPQPHSAPIWKKLLELQLQFRCN